jgi:hypothetical protein
MSRLTERIATHPTLTLLEQVRQYLAELPASDDPSTMKSVQRLQQVTERVRSLVAEADPALVSPQLLQVLVSPLTTTRDNLEQYAQTAEARFLAQAEEGLDALIAVVGWPVGYAFKKPAGMGQAAAAYRDAVQSNLGSLHQQVDQLTAQLAVLQTELEQARTTVATAASEGEARLAAASTTADATLAASITAAETRATALAVTAEEHLATLATAVETHKARLDTLTESYTAQFAAEQKARDANAAAALTEETARHENARTEAADAFQKALAEWSADAHATLDKLAAYDAEAERRGNDLLGALAGRAMAGGYGKYADDQRRAADWLRRGAVAVGAVAILWSIGVAVFALSSAFEWVLLLRFLAAVPILAIALYLGEQSGKHRDAERQARRSELELAAIDPYLASLEPVKRGEVKEKLADRMFAQQQPPTEAPSDVIKRLFDLMDKLIKKQ